MNRREDILMELKSISDAVAAIPFVNVFNVDSAYFSAMPQIIMAQINVGDSFNNLTVPDGYFERLAGNILKRIHALENDVIAELNEISPLIAGIGSKETYTVPEGYFNKLSFVEKQQETAKVISISKRRSFFKYAAAAVITGLLGLSIVNIVDNNHETDSSTMIAKITTGTLQQNALATNGSFDEALKNISDNEIEQYLQKNGQDVNAALVASSTDEIDKLPEATDYLLDENTLENYLKQNNLKN